MATRRGVLGVLGAAALGGRASAAEPVRLGLLHTLSPAPIYMAQESGYFADVGLDVAFRFFESAQPIAAACVSGDVDVGITALTGGFFALAQKSGLRVIGGGLHEQAGFDGTAVLVSNAAYAAGLTSLGKLDGRSVAITQYGSSFHYMLGQIARNEGFDLKSVVLRPLQQVGNMVAAVKTGQVDATFAIASMARPLEAAGQAHIIGWVGDSVPYQLTALFTSRRMIDARGAVVRAFCDAYRRGVDDYRAAFLTVAPASKAVVGPATERAIAQIRKYVFASNPDAPRLIQEGVGWYDRDAALDVADIANQVAWFEEQGLVKDRIDPASIVDTRFLPVR